jgi:type II secretory pathway pseudopilin PulG
MKPVGRSAGAMRAAGHARSRQGGYAYLALLILIAIIGVVAAATAQLGNVYQRRMAEKELLFVGGEFQRALSSYASQTPVGQLTQPHVLDDLVHDPRYPNPVHHLRKVYADPITGKTDWVLVMSPDGQTIVGIHSASLAHPIQIAQFPAEFQGFEDRHTYAQWIFVAQLPQVPGQAPVSVPPSGVAPGGVAPNNDSFPLNPPLPPGGTTSTGSGFGLEGGTGGNTSSGAMSGLGGNTSSGAITGFGGKTLSGE